MRELHRQEVTDIPLPSSGWTQATQHSQSTCIELRISRASLILRNLFYRAFHRNPKMLPVSMGLHHDSHERLGQLSEALMSGAQNLLCSLAELEKTPGCRLWAAAVFGVSTWTWTVTTILEPWHRESASCEDCYAGEVRCSISITSYWKALFTDSIRGLEAPS